MRIACIPKLIGVAVAFAMLLPLQVLAQDGESSAPSDAQLPAPVQPGLESAVSQVQRGVRVHTASLIGGLIFPPVWLIGTSVGANTTVRAARSYRDVIADLPDQTGSPSLGGAREWHITGLLGHGVSGVALATLVGMGVAQMDPTIDLEREIGIAGGLFAGGLVVGLVGTTVAAWRARNGVMRFHERRLNRPESAGSPDS